MDTRQRYRLEHSRKRFHYPGAESWIAKLDTVVHELFHIDPLKTGLRQMVRNDGTNAHRCHSPEFFTEVASLVRQYLATNPDPAMCRLPALRFRRIDRALRPRDRHGLPRVSFLSAVSRASRRAAGGHVDCHRHIDRDDELSGAPPPVSDADLDLREFFDTGSRRAIIGSEEEAA